MKRFIHITLVLLIVAVSSQQSYSQEYTFDDFVGTWHGYISSESFAGYHDDMTMDIQPDGFYTETSNHLMPTIYPNTQECEFDEPTNRMHWWYLQTVYVGQFFYQHFFYDVVYFNNDTLEMHYNYWDDPEPHPTVGTIFLVRENLTPPPSNLAANAIGNNVVLFWDEPSNSGGPAAELQGYNVYSKVETGSVGLLEYVEDDHYSHEDITDLGVYTYYVTAVFEEGESDPSNEVVVELVATGIEDPLSENTLIYPNPATDVVNIKTTSRIMRIEVYNYAGSKMFEKYVDNTSYKLNTSQLNTGVYIFRIFSNDGSVVKQVIIE